MRKITIAILVVLTFTVSSAQTKKTFDKFKNITNFMTAESETSKVTFDGGKDASPLIRRMGMVIGFTCDGQVDSCAPNMVELLFIGYTSDWTMKGGNTVTLLIDGKPVTAGKAGWDGQVLDADDLVEYNDVTIGPELLKKMASAKAVDVQLGLFEFSLTDANLASIREIASHAGWMPAS